MSGDNGEMTTMTREAGDGAGSERVRGLERQLDEALVRLDEAAPFAKVRYQTEVFRVAADLLDSDEGAHALDERAPRLESAGAFAGGPWEDPGRLLPDLVGVGLKGEGVVPTIEALSELRITALATGDATNPHMSADEAREFLQEICAKNLDLMFPHPTEESRARPKVFARAERVFRLVREHVPLEGLRAHVLEEIDLLCAQRPVRTKRILALIEQAARVPDGEEDSEAQARLDLYQEATGGATPLARASDDPAAYRASTLRLSDEEVRDEARVFAGTLQATGLASPYHTVLLRRIARKDPEALPDALGVGESGRAEIGRNAELVAQLVRLAVLPHTAPAVAGLVGVMERGLLSRSEVAGGLRRLVEIEIRPDVVEVMLDRFPDSAGLSATSVLLAGTLGVLGRPLGIGQGNNPTCQAARGLSLWSLHGPGLLLGMIATAARDGFVKADFEGQSLRSDELEPGLAKDAVDLDLDPVSKLLVPHLDRIYTKMMQLVSLRPEDGHKWVNPAMYGRWVQSGFASAIDPTTGAVRHHAAFVRRFFATHHPDYNDGHELIYPNPVGIMVTDVHGALLGPHAVSIQRIAESPEGEMRVFFFNPNNEGRQDWGRGTTPTVSGNGEQPGESSLPFEGFVSRLYAFHFDPLEEGDAFAVPEETVSAVSRLAAETWGRAYAWIG
ncbi:MAG TPA: hypothetical protein VKU85_11000 [bacterium]|nr:hypothetical protein [bacterium]